MATINPFDLLGDDDNDDPSHLIATQQQKIVAAAAAAKKLATPPPAAAKLPSKPLPPAQAVKESRSNTDPTRGAGRGGPGRGRGGRGVGAGLNRDFGNVNANGFSRGYGGGAGGEDRDGGRERGTYGAPRGSFRGGRRGGYGNGDIGVDSEQSPRRVDSEQPPRRTYERRSGTGRGYEMKREGAGRGNWGSSNDDALPQETEDGMKTGENVASPEKNPEKQELPASEAIKDNKEGRPIEAEEKEEDKEMTLEEYEKVREEKRKALLAMKSQERKVDFDKEFESMQQLSLKKDNGEVFIKLGSDKEGKKKENPDERVKKSVSINEFLKPAEGGRYYNPGGRGRGRGRVGERGGFRGGFGDGGSVAAAPAPSIEDPGQFPTLGGK